MQKAKHRQQQQHINNHQAFLILTNKTAATTTTPINRSKLVGKYISFLIISKKSRGNRKKFIFANLS